MAEPVAEATAELGARIRALRKEQGYSQESFAHACDFDRSYMGQLERGERNLSFRNLLRVSDTLEVDPAVLVAGLVSW